MASARNHGVPQPLNYVTPEPPAGGRVGHFRWVICGLLFFATAINYIDRQVFSILAPKLQVTIGWSEAADA